MIMMINQLFLYIIGYANQWGQVKSKKPNNKKTMAHNNNNNKPNGGKYRENVF